MSMAAALFASVCGGDEAGVVDESPDRLYIVDIMANEPANVDVRETKSRLPYEVQARYGGSPELEQRILEANLARMEEWKP